MYKTLLASAIFFLLSSIAALAIVSDAPLQVANTPAGKIAKDVVVVTKPHFRYQQRHDIELANENGLVGDDTYTYLDFKAGKKIYSAWWRSRSSFAPVYLSQDLRYRFVLRLEDESSKCKVVRIWRGKDLIWENPETPEEAHLADESAIREKLDHIRIQLFEAFKDKDVKAYTKFVAPNYSVTMIGGHEIKQSRSELESEARSDMDNTVSLGPIIREIKELRVNGTNITIVVYQKSSRVFRDEGSTHKLKVGIVQRERWAESDEGLRITSVEALEIIYQIEDGELVSGSKKTAIDRRRARSGQLAARPGRR